MAKDKTEFLRFSAYSIKDLITRKLSENTAFTDQIYEGSNLAILIDLISYMYQCLVYCLNNAAAESMFEDTQIYENISRLINLIGYHPRGCYPSTMRLNISYDAIGSGKIAKIYPYTSIDTGLTDSQGRNIFFSTRRINYITENINNINFEKDGILSETFYNGQWKIYSTIFTSSGADNQSFILDGLRSDSSDNAYVAGDFIDVMVFDPATGDVEFWDKDQEGLFTNSHNTARAETSNTTIYGSDQPVFDIRLNQNKVYEIKFGDGIIGKKPRANAKIIIFYLDTNGSDGEIDMDQLDFSNLKLERNAATLGVSEDLLQTINKAMVIEQSDDSIIDITEMEEEYTIKPEVNCVTKFVPEEDISDIKSNAPNWFKLGNRLITRKDYEYFIKNMPEAKTWVGGKDIIDVKCMNNIEYVSTFYKWLYMWGRRAFNDGRHYFNTKFWQRTNYKQVDPADGNNTYLWIKVSNPSPEYDDQFDGYEIGKVEDQLNQVLQSMKTLTTELQVMKPVIVNFDICACTNIEYIRQNYLGSTRPFFDEKCESYIEITLDDNTLYASTSIQQQVYNIIVDSFNVEICRMGQNIDYSEILNKIYSISGVKRVRTVFMKESENSIQQYAFDGLSFASWSSVLNDDAMSGVDLDVSNNIRHLEEFQFPRFIGSAKLSNRIQVIKRQMTTINTIKM